MNNKGFAISTTMYLILVLSLILIITTLSILNSRKMTLDKIKDTTLSDIKTKMNIGDSKKYLDKEVFYKNTSYYVMYEGNDYVTVIKTEPLTYNEISSYNENVIDQNGYGYINYGTNIYNTSLVKTVLDRWIEDNIDLDDLKEVNGYKYRLFNNNDRHMSLNRVMYTITTIHRIIYPTSYAYFTMETNNDKINVVNNDQTIIEVTANDKYAIKPILNIYKSELDVEENE